MTANWPATVTVAVGQVSARGLLLQQGDDGQSQ